MASFIQKLKSPEGKQQILLVLSALKNTRLMMLLMLALAISYMLIWDQLWLPELKKSEVLSMSLEEAKKRVEAVNAIENTVNTIKEQLATFKQNIPKVVDNGSAQVLAVSASKQVLDIINGTSSGRLGTKLETPYNRLTVKTIRSGAPKTIDVSPSVKELAAIGQTLNLWRFTYEIEAEGTYIALVNVLNEMFLMDNTVAIDKIELTSKGQPYYITIPKTTVNPLGFLDSIGKNIADTGKMLPTLPAGTPAVPPAPTTPLGNNAAKSETPIVPPRPGKPLTPMPVSLSAPVLPPSVTPVTPVAPAASPDLATGATQTERAIAVPLDIKLYFSVFVADPTAG